MYKVTNQQLYNDIRQGLDGVQISESSAEEMYSAIKDTLQDQEGFTEELIEKCASVAFDAVTDLYMESQGSQAQTQFSEDNIEELFAAEDQETYATWVGRGASYITAGLKGIGAAIGNTKKSYARKMDRESSGRSARFGNSGKGGFWSRLGQTAAGHMDDVRAADRKRNEEVSRTAEKIRNRQALKDKGGFMSGFRDRKGNIMGMKGGLSGMKEWAKDNKTHAAIAGGATAAAVGGAGYLAYRAYKKRKAAQAAQAGLNATHQVQPNV